MAKKYALVPHEWLQQLNKKSFEEPPPHDNYNPQPSITVPEITDRTEERRSISDLVQLFPKRQQSRVKLLGHYLDDKVNLDGNDHVIYNDGEVGSHIIDFIRYFVMPFPAKRPHDAPKFKALMDNSGIPLSIMSKNNDRNRPAEWKKF